MITKVIITVCLIITSLYVYIQGYSQGGKKDKEARVNKVDTSRVGARIAQWNSVGAVTTDFNEEGIRNIDRNQDTLLRLFSRRRKKGVVLQYIKIYKIVPILVLVNDTTTYYHTMMNDTLAPYYYTPNRHHLNFLKKLLNKKN